MSEVKVSEPVAAPAAKVWKLLGDFGGVTKWGRQHDRELPGRGVRGRRRAHDRASGRRIDQGALEAYDAAGRTLTYSIIEKGPIQSAGTCPSVASSRPVRMPAASTGKDASSPTARPRSRRRASCAASTRAGSQPCGS